MRGIIRPAAAAAAACLGLVVPAVAADVVPPPIFVEVPPYVPPPAPTPQPEGAWYLRGDIGYKIYVAPAASLPYPNYGDLISETLANTWLVGIGVGFDTGTGFRADLTLDYEFPSEFEGQLICPSAGCFPGPEYSTETADISALTLLANVYWDFARIYGFTPYVGAGIGLAWLTVDNVHSVNPDLSEQDHLGASSWNLAWALTAGTGIQLSEQLTLDVNYRYLFLGDAVSGPIPIGPDTTNFLYENIAAHEVRAGLRLSFY